MVHTTGYADVNGARLYYETAGAGPALVFVHGFNLDTRMWDDQFDELAKHFTCIRYDMRGFGKSSKASGDFRNYDDLAGLLDYLKIEKAHVCGLSFGGYTSLEFALAHPNRLERLVLVASGLMGFPMTDTRQADVQTFNGVLQTGDLEASVNVFTNQWLEGPGQAPGRVPTPLRERFLDMVQHAFTLPKPESFPQFLTPPVIERLHEIKAPTLILAGELDYPDISQIATLLHGRITLSELIVLPNIAHIVNMEIPVQFNDMVLDFLQS
jgi:pimeloyl-ACP methyl ester carboxylesterase